MSKADLPGVPGVLQRVMGMALGAGRTGQRVFFIQLTEGGSLSAVAEDDYEACKVNWADGRPAKGPFDPVFTDLLRIIDPESLTAIDEEGAAILLAACAAQRLR